MDFIIIAFLLLIYVSYRLNQNKIPNIIHFIFGLKPQKDEFLFIYYLSVLSAYIVNGPDKIYFYYHYEPYGKWWNRLKEKIPIIIFEIPYIFFSTISKFLIKFSFSFLCR